MGSERRVLLAQQSQGGQRHHQECAIAVTIAIMKALRLWLCAAPERRCGGESTVQAQHSGRRAWATATRLRPATAGGRQKEQVCAWRMHGAFELSGPQLSVEKEIKKARRMRELSRRTGSFMSREAAGGPCGAYRLPC
jgi:hypothetical protein